MKKRLLLTGYKGFIGKHFFKKACDEFDVIPVDLIDGNDLCNEEYTNTLPDVDLIFHLAAYNGTRHFYNSPTEVLINNTLPTINLVKRYQKSNSKFVFASTCEIFNGATDLNLSTIPTSEDTPILFKDIINPRWSYSLPKALGENLVSNSGLEWLVIRFFNIYGPGQKDHFFSEFISRVMKGDYTLNGNDTRSFCYVDDAVKICSKLILNISNQIVNVGTDNETKIEDVAKIILQKLKINPDKLNTLNSPNGSAKRRCPDISKLTELIGHIEFTTLDEGIDRVLRDYS